MLVQTYVNVLFFSRIRYKTKLHAALARSRIKARVLTLDHLLPGNLRQKDKVGNNMHLYCWVNQLKVKYVRTVVRFSQLLYAHVQLTRTHVRHRLVLVLLCDIDVVWQPSGFVCSSRVRTVLERLELAGFVAVPCADRLVGKTYLLDHQCDDLIAFPAELRPSIEGHPLVQQGYLVLQVSGSFHTCVAVSLLYCHM